MASNLWITHRDYQSKLRPSKLVSVMKSIGEDNMNVIVQAQKKNENTGILLVHPTEETISFEQIAENDLGFKRIVTAITNGIDILKMHRHSLEKEMPPEGGDAKESRLLSGIVDRFGHSGIPAKLQALVHNVVWHGETYGWVPIRDVNNDVPIVPTDYVIAKVIPTEEFVCRDYENRPLRIVFLWDLDSNIRPRSTVTYMASKCQSMEFLRQQHLQSIFYASKPNYIASHKIENGDTPKQDKGLDVSLANQARMNEELESMVSETVRATNYAKTIQKRTTLGGNLYSFVSGMGSKHIQDKQARETLERKIQELQDSLEQCNPSNLVQPPLKWILPNHLEATSSNLNVQQFDILSFEKRHDMDWLASSTGCTTEATHSDNRREKQPASHMDMLSMARKQKVYCQQIVYGILNQWIERTGIGLAVPDFDWVEKICEKSELDSREERSK